MVLFLRGRDQWRQPLPRGVHPGSVPAVVKNTVKQTLVTPSGTVHVVGAPRERLRDYYHLFLRWGWGRALASVVVGFLSLNVVFACLYDIIGGISNARIGSFSDAFFFSVQTMATIGYGDMHPATTVAHIVVVAEAVVGLLVTAIVTGLVFAKFSVSTSRIVFSRHATISPMNGLPTLMFRLGNERSNSIVEAQLRVTLMRSEHTKEGVLYYRMYELKLLRDRSQAFSRSWSALHVIDEESPLYGETPESLHAKEIELVCGVIGTDDTSLQAVHAQHTYLDTDIVFGARHADILTENEDGSITLDLHRFHDIQPTQPIAGFPYSTA
jgi:inward rectifier potassium channel